LQDFGDSLVCLRSPDELYAWRDTNPFELGFVPTMGYLHQGHLSLVKRSCDENAQTIVSIFVNPTQFSIEEDLEDYPRDEERDIAALTKLGVDAVYIPTIESMYPSNFDTFVQVESLTERLEGDSRPGHFRGVATVVTKLLSAMHPSRVYFGKKDAQQLRVIQRLVEDLNISSKIIPCETVRESDGLALSSRNVYLSATERRSAPVLYKSLLKAQDSFSNGERSADRLRSIVREVLDKESLFQVDYVSLADETTLVEVNGILKKHSLLMVAVQLGDVRLLDNVELVL